MHSMHDLAAFAAQAPPDGILSRTVHHDDAVKVVWFGFAPGQELSEHTASVPAILHVLSGEGTLVAGAERIEARPGVWLHMEAKLSHAVRAATPMTLLLTMLKRA
jgi:quercetin dioxygenase-like cupin family protein